MSTMSNKQTKFPEHGAFVKKGMVLMEAKPFVHVLYSKYRTECCDYCLKNNKISKCSGCQYVYYCNRTCQKRSWSIHKIECPNMKRIYPREIPDAARIMSKILIKMHNGKAEERGYYSPTEYRTFKDLVSHTVPDTCSMQGDPDKIEHFTSLCMVLRSYLPASLLPEVKELFAIFGKISFNSFEIEDLGRDGWVGTGIGAGVYLGPSILDHSCKPNAYYVFNGPDFVIRALQDIPSFDLSKIFITYTDALSSVEERRDSLQESHYFWCECERCTDPEDIHAALACPNKTCTNPCFLKDSECSKCGKELSLEWREEIERVMSETLRHLEKEKDQDLDVWRSCLQQQEQVLHPLHVLYIRTLEKAQGALLRSELWDGLLTNTEKLMEKYTHLYGDAHPMTESMYLQIPRVKARLHT